MLSNTLYARTSIYQAHRVDSKRPLTTAGNGSNRASSLALALHGRNELPFQCRDRTGEKQAAMAEEDILLGGGLRIVGGRENLHGGWMGEFREQLIAKSEVLAHPDLFG